MAPQRQDDGRHDGSAERPGARPAVDLFGMMSTARSIRRYLPDPVPDEVLHACLEAATWAPSGTNRQPWRFVVLRSAETRAVLGPAYRAGWAAKAADIGVDRLAPDDRSPRARMARAVQHFVDHFEEVPACVLFCLALPAGRRPDLLAGASIYPAMQNFILAARAHGLGTVMTAWWTSCEPELRTVVGVPDGWRIAGLLPVGYPVGSHGPLRRRPVTEVAYADTWGTPLEPPVSARSSGPAASR
jgi:nitroreductase